MIQLLSIVVFVAYLLSSPQQHEKFQRRLVWFGGATTALIGVSTAHSLPMVGNLGVLLVSALPLLLAYPHASNSSP